MSKVEALACAPPPGLYPAGGDQWHLACGFGEGGVSRVKGSAGAPHLPGLIVLGGFSGALLVGPILDIVYDCYL